MRPPAWRRYLTFWRSPVVQDVDDELRFHTNMRVQEYVARGMSEPDARRAVAERLGNIDVVTAECVELGYVRERNARNVAFVDALRSDLGYAIRGLRARPGFAATIIVTLALGIGANAAVFSVVDRLLFRTAPMLRDVNRTHRIYVSRPNGNGVGNFFQDEIEYVRFASFSSASTAFARTAGFVSNRLPVGAPEEGVDRQVAAVTASFFSFFDAPPTLGRYFDPQEDGLPSGQPVLVLSYATWQTDYAGRSDAIGAKIRIGPTMYTVIGVAPKWFVGLWPDVPPMAFIPFSSYAAATARELPNGLRWWTAYDQGTSAGMLVTLKPGASIDRVSAELTANMRTRWSDRVIAGPPDLQPTIVVGSTVAERRPDQSSASKVAALVGAMALVVLLIAAANVASLLLARALRRRREMAVRLALGISRPRLTAQLLTETLLLAVLGGLAGLIAAWWGGPALRATFLSPSADTAVVTDVRTLTFVGVAVAIAGVLTGLAPAWQARTVDVTHYLRGVVRDGTQRSRARGLLLVVQGALSVLLLVAAGLFVRSLVNVRRTRLGFDADRLLVVNVNTRDVRLDSAARADLWTRLASAARLAPGVERASLAHGLPFVGGTADVHAERPKDIDYAHWIQLPDINSNAVTPDYFATMQTRILRGRGIDSSDVLGGPSVAVVSRRFANALWPGRDAIGQCLSLLRVDPRTNRPVVSPCTTTVVGVAEDIQFRSLGEDDMLYFYVPYAQERPGRSSRLAIRTYGEAAHHAEAVRAVLQREMPASTLVSVTPLSDVIGGRMRSWKLGAVMFVAFGVLAMVLAALGLYSAVAYDVAQRTHEIGVRRALGAQAVDVVALVVRQGLTLGGLGVVIGGSLALITAKQIQPLLFDVSPRDPAVYSVVIAMMLVIAGAAAFVPARRAAAVDPNIALRSD